MLEQDILSSAHSYVGYPFITLSHVSDVTAIVSIPMRLSYRAFSDIYYYMYSCDNSTASPQGRYSLSCRMSSAEGALMPYGTLLCGQALPSRSIAVFRERFIASVRVTLCACLHCFSVRNC